MSNESADNKVLAALSYIGVLVLIPLFMEKESRFVRFHANQGLVLTIVLVIYEVIYRIIAGTIGRIFLLGGIFTFVISLFKLVIIVLSIMGIINVVQGKMKELPVIGGITLIK